MDLSTCGLTGSLPDIHTLVNLQFIDISANSLIGEFPSEQPRMPFLRDLDISSNYIAGTLPLWLSNVTFNVYLINNPLECPYPTLPQNVHVDSNCVSGWWYEGTLTILVALSVAACLTITVVVVSLSVFFGIRPALLTVLTEENGRELDVDHLHLHAQHLTRFKTILFAFCSLELFVSLVSFCKNSIILRHL